MEKKGYKSAFAIVTLLFFMWGFLTCLNDILVPHLKAVFDMNYTQTMLIQFTFFGAYLLMSIPAGKLIARIGYQLGVVAGLCTSGIGALLFYPAAGMLSYPLFLLGLFILATGITVLQVAANPYASVLGKPETASSRLNLAQAVNSFGHTTAPYIGGILILGSALSAEQIAALPSVEQHAARITQASSVQMPYIGLAIALFVLALVMKLFHLPVIETVESHDSKKAHLRDALKIRHTRLAAIGIFLYVGAEVSIGSFLVNFFGQKEIGGLTPEVAAKYVSFYWGAAMVGRFIGSALLQKLKSRGVLAVAATFAAILVVTTIMLTGTPAMYTILAVGFFNSVMFPIIFTLGIEDLGHLTSQGSSILVMAIFGGAVIPELQGVLADSIGIHTAFFLPALCYLYIIYYALVGSKHPTTNRVAA